MCVRIYTLLLFLNFAALSNVYPSANLLLIKFSAFSIYSINVLGLLWHVSNVFFKIDKNKWNHQDNIFGLNKYKLIFLIHDLATLSLQASESNSPHQNV